MAVDFIKDVPSVNKKYWTRPLPQFPSIAFFSPHVNRETRLCDMELEDVINIYGSEFAVPIYVQMVNMDTGEQSVHANILFVSASKKKAMRVDPNGKLGTGTCDEVVSTYGDMNEEISLSDDPSTSVG